MIITGCLLAAAVAVSHAAEGGEASSRPALEVLWSQTCGPCRRLVSDWNADEHFRDWVSSRFVVTWRESSDYPLPRINVLGQTLTGYASKDPLAKRLQQLLSQRVANCRDVGGRGPTQVMPSPAQNFVAAVVEREQKLRAEISRFVVDFDARLNQIDASLHTHSEKLNELVGALNESHTSDSGAGEQISELRAQLQVIDQWRRQARQTREECHARLSAISVRLDAIENRLLSPAPAPARAPVSAQSPASPDSLAAVETGDGHPSAGDQHGHQGSTHPDREDAARAPVDGRHSRLDRLFAIGGTTLKVLGILGVVGGTTGGAGAVGYAGWWLAKRGIAAVRRRRRAQGGRSKSADFHEPTTTTITTVRAEPRQANPPKAETPSPATVWERINPQERRNDAGVRVRSIDGGPVPNRFPTEDQPVCAV